MASAALVPKFRRSAEVKCGAGTGSLGWSCLYVKLSVCVPSVCLWVLASYWSDTVLSTTPHQGLGIYFRNNQTGNRLYFYMEEGRVRKVALKLFAVYCSEMLTLNPCWNWYSATSYQYIAILYKNSNMRSLNVVPSIGYHVWGFGQQIGKFRWQHL